MLSVSAFTTAFSSILSDPIPFVAAPGGEAVDLPQIVTVGSQSSGKSSVLEVRDRAGTVTWHI